MYVLYALLLFRAVKRMNNKNERLAFNTIDWLD